MLTDEVGKSVEVICCAAWSFQLPLLLLLKFEVPFHIPWWLWYVHFLIPLGKFIW